MSWCYEGYVREGHVASCMGRSEFYFATRHVAKLELDNGLPMAHLVWDVFSCSRVDDEGDKKCVFFFFVRPTCRESDWRNS